MQKIRFIKDEPLPDLGFLYRVVDSYDGYYIHEFKILSETPKGFWVGDFVGFGKKRWVAKEGKNNYAKQTKEEALKNYYYRKQSQIRHLERHLKAAKIRYQKVALEIDAPTGMYKPNVLDLVKSW